MGIEVTSAKTMSMSIFILIFAFIFVPSRAKFMRIMKRNSFAGQHQGYHLSLVPNNGIRPEMISLPDLGWEKVDDDDKTWLGSTVTFVHKRSDFDCGFVRLLKRSTACP